MRTFRVVAADDSAVMRKLLTRMFAEAEMRAVHDVRFELCATVADGNECVAVARALRPDLVLMDLHMPRSGGLDAVELLRREFPALPIVMCSAYTARGAAETLEALARGASDYVTKPRGTSDAASAIAALWEQLVPKLQALLAPGETAGQATVQGSSARIEAGTAMPEEAKGSAAKVVAIGVSTGGPAALEELLPLLPADLAAPVVIVQHMPKLFTSALAERLDRVCRLRVKLAETGEVISGGGVWLAPGDRHIELTGAGVGPARILLHEGPPVHHCRPAVDVLFHSVARVFGARALALVLTGMGSDGLEGGSAIAAAGGAVLAQDKASSAVWGMPGRVWQAGVASAALPLQELASEVVARTGRTGLRAVNGRERLRREDCREVA